MKNLLKFEFHKLFKAKSFYICTAIIFLMSLLTVAISVLFSNIQVEGMTITKAGPLETMINAISSSNFTMISGIFVAIFACYDYEQQTIKNVYSHGFSRNKVYFAKFIVCMAATLIMFALTLIFNYLLGLGLLNGPYKDGNYLGLILGQIIYCITYSSFIFALALIIKKTGFSIALAILGPSLITLVITLVDSLLKLKEVKISSYWFGSFSSDLVSLATTNNRLLIVIGLSIAYCVLFVLGGYFINRKQEN